MVNINLIGQYIYPSYVGLIIFIFGLVGGIMAHYKNNRNFLFIFWVFLVLFLISFGTTTEIYRHIPFSNQLDVARFWLYMMPFLSISAGYGINEILQTLFKIVKKRLRIILIILLFSLIIYFHSSDVKRSLESFKPYEYDITVQQALNHIKFDNEIKRILG